MRKTTISELQYAIEHNNHLSMHTQSQNETLDRIFRNLIKNLSLESKYIMTTRNSRFLPLPQKKLSANENAKSLTMIACLNQLARIEKWTTDTKRKQLITTTLLPDTLVGVGYAIKDEGIHDPRLTSTVTNLLTAVLTKEKDHIILTTAFPETRPKQIDEFMIENPLAIPQIYVQETQVPSILRHAHNLDIYKNGTKAERTIIDYTLANLPVPISEKDKEFAKIIRRESTFPPITDEYKQAILEIRKTYDPGIDPDDDDFFSLH